MGLRHHLKKLGERIKQHEGYLAELPDLTSLEGKMSYSTDIPWPSVWKFAKFAYIAERYGYRYDGLDPEFQHGDTPFFAFRRLPDAREYILKTSEEYPSAFTGGQLPGMHSWFFLVWPTSRTRREVKLLHARIKVDYATAIRRQPWGKWTIGIPVVIFIALVVNGQLGARGLRLGAVLALVLITLLAASRLVLRVRQRAYQKLLEEARKQDGRPSGDGER